MGMGSVALKVTNLPLEELWGWVVWPLGNYGDG